MCLTFDPARTEPKFENRDRDGAAAVGVWPLSDWHVNGN